MSVIPDILAFREALGIGNFHPRERRAIYSITLSEAMELRRLLARQEPTKYMRYGPLEHGSDVVTLPTPIDLPAPEPGPSWGGNYGMQVFVEGTPTLVERGRRLLAEALHLRMFGEHAPGGAETWAMWDRAAEDYLRSFFTQ